MADTLVTIQGKLILGDGSGLGGGTITCRLSKQDGANTPAGGGVEQVVANVEAPIADDGTVNFTLTPNDAITPAGTKWLVAVVPQTPGGRRWHETWNLPSTPNPTDIGAIPRE